MVVSPKSVGAGAGLPDLLQAAQSRGRTPVGSERNYVADTIGDEIRQGRLSALAFALSPNSSDWLLPPRMPSSTFFPIAASVGSGIG